MMGRGGLAARVSSLEQRARPARPDLPFWVDWSETSRHPDAITLEQYREKYGTDPEVIFKVVYDAPAPGEVNT